LIKTENATRETVPLYALIAEGIEQQIRSGKLHAGSVLMVNTIARSLDLSRAPVQSALEILLERRLIVSNGSSYKVAGGNAPDTSAAHEQGAPFLPADMEDRIRNSVALWQNISFEAEAQIGAAIPFGRFRIVEARMAESYGVSRTVVRNVLGRLEERGLVARDHRGGCTCGPLTEERIAEIYEARILLEPYALRKVAASLELDWIDQCLGKLKHVAARYPNVPPAELEDLETDLHVRTFATFDNSILRQTIESTRLIVISTTQLFQRIAGLPTTDPFLKEHTLVFEQLAAGAVELAEAALRHHLIRAERTTRSRFQALPKDAIVDLPSYLTRMNEDG
jgi:DNA-binding GntR family transcriptional regulator